MHSVKNTTKGPRFVYVRGEPKLIEGGQILPFDLTDTEIVNVQHQVDAGLLAWDGEAPKAKADAGGDLTAAQLLAQAEGMNFMAFKSAAAKVLGAPAPGKKEDIVAALDEKAKADAGAQA